MQNKAFYRAQHPFMIKSTLNQVLIKGTCLNLTKDIFDKPIVKSYFLVKESQNLFTKFRNKTRMSTLTTFIQHSNRIPSQRN